MQLIGYLQSVLLLCVIISALVIIIGLLFSKNHLVIRYKITQRAMYVFLGSILLNFIIQSLFPYLTSGN